MAPHPLAPDALAALRREWAAALDSTTGLDPAELMDSLRELERLVCTATAAQAALAVELDDAVRADHAALKVPAARQGRGVGSMVAHARRESPHRGARHLGLARVVARELPHTWSAWRRGRITEWSATLVARETACLDLEDRLAVDELVCADHDALEALGPRGLVGRLHAEVARLDPAAVVRRRRNAESDRHVTLRPAPDTMTWLTALLPVKDGVAVHAALVAAADSARAGGDDRSRGQLMADTLVGRATGAQPSDAAPVALHVVLGDQALLGDDESPAHLDGFGAIPAELARELVRGVLDAGDELWLRRLYTRPTTGELVAMDSRARLFPAGLAHLIRLRDQVCRTPWCDAPIRHIDHTTAHEAGGETSLGNGQGLCEACNHAKQAPRWRAGPDGDGGVETTLPTGHRYRSRAPVIASVRGTPLRIDYVLAG